MATITNLETTDNGSTSRETINTNFTNLNTDKLESSDLSSYATLTGTETLTNKTLTSPVVNSPIGIVKADVGLGNVPNLSFSGSNTGDETVATGAEIDTGTDDEKMVTPKAIKDSKLSYTDGTETLTNKTLTDPVISKIVTTSNGDIELAPNGTGIVKGELHTASFTLAASDTDLATGTSIGGDWRIPGNKAITIKSVGAYVDTAGTTGVSTFDINEAGTSILSTKITIDSGKKTSKTATTPPVISDSSIAADAILTFDIDGVSTTAPKGLKIWIEFIYN